MIVKIMKNNTKTIISGIIVIVSFLLISYVLQSNIDVIKNYLDIGIWGIILYLLITTVATVLGPISALPILPVAVVLWGWKITALLSIVGWTIGSVIAFLLARRYGVRIIERFASMDKIRVYEAFIPKKDIFLGIILVRIFLPVDFLSYALGMVSTIRLSTYTLATFIGMIPFAIVLSYIGSVPITYQIISLSVGGLFFLVLYYKIFLRIKRNKERVKTDDSITSFK